MQQEVAVAFHAFIDKYSRSYRPGTSEYQRRFALFEANHAEVKRQNAQPKRLWTASINFLADSTPEERQALNGWRGRRSLTSNQEAAGSFLQAALRPDPLPKDVSWLHLQTTHKENIRAQRCANCWAAATAALMEAHHEIYRKEFRRFDEEEMTVCTPDPYSCGGSGGCGGATPELAMQELLINGVSEAHNASSSQACRKAHRDAIVDPMEQPPYHEWGPGIRQAAENSQGKQFGLIGWQRLPENRYEPVMRALYEKGPVAVAVSTDWHSYGAGIYDGCSKNALVAHSVIAIGYGEDPDIARNTAGGYHRSPLATRRASDQLPSAPVKYWLLQNSWGQDWGENGHIRLLREDDEETSWCGTDKQPEQGTTCKDGPKEVRVCGRCGILYDTVVPIMERKP